jgi:transposase
MRRRRPVPVMISIWRLVMEPALGMGIGLAKVPPSPLASSLAAAIRYALARWNGLGLFLEDGRVEIDNNTIERAIRPLALSRKNALFGGFDGGAEHWVVAAFLIEACKLTSVEPHGYLADIITRIVNGHPQSRIDELLPWAYSTALASCHMA